MRNVRIIPCLDVAGGRVVKGVNFEDLKDAGDPVELALRYQDQGAGEVAFLDISASAEGKETTFETVRRTSEALSVPLTVGGGIRSVEDAARVFDSGAAKVSLSTAAVLNPGLITEIASRFGSEVLILSADARRTPGESLPNGEPRYEVTISGGTRDSGRELREWVVEAEERGVGEILLNSMDADGVQGGYDLEMLSTVRELTTLPLIASGGAGQVSDFVAAAEAGADAVLAASVFHFQKVTIPAVRAALERAGFVVPGAR